MKLQKLIGSELVYLQLEAVERETALEAVAERMTAHLAVPASQIARALVDRERLGSTSVGDGFAIPHCKLAGLKSISIALARFREGIEFGSTDSSRVQFFFVVLSPPDQPAAHLQVLSQIARVLKRQELRSRLLEAADGPAVVEVIQQFAEAEGL
jgi:mannitol/fructose-specific phosphotransferase system IIA component (Ntr-type)